MTRYRFDAEVWPSGTNAAWHFATVPFDIADEIEELTTGNQGGFGSVRVEVTIGSSTWKTSLFPDGRRQSFILPVKKPVRAEQGIVAGDTVTFEIELVDR